LSDVLIEQAEGNEFQSGSTSNSGANAMKVVVFVKASPEYEAGQMPSTELLTRMGRYNEELVKAGIMLAGDGLKPSSKRSGFGSRARRKQ